ncbi:MAG TPA: biotin/lipoyl-binding protein [Candidatus Caccomorpha excrementavium]|nr:biotin/lipoyl-binding protein [Candidatus Caccomorpha excrementavium]
MKKYKVTLNGRTYEVEVEAGKAMLVDEYEAYAPAPAASAPASAPAAAAAPAAPAASTAPAAAPAVQAAGETITAPMPGNILRIEVTNGAAVKAGQILIVLEAMKMENEILAPRDGTVAQIIVQKGSTVETGSPLVVLA